MSDFTFLTEEQYFGDDKLDILERRGTKAAITDFSILLGAYVSDYHIDNDSSLEGRTGYYWTNQMTEIMTRAWLTIMVVGIASMFSYALVGLAQLYRSRR